MSFGDRTFDDLWNGEEEFELVDWVLPLVGSAGFCRYAKKFAEWAHELFSEMTKDPTVLRINQAMLLLMKKYFDWYSSVPERHRDCAGDKEHVCIFKVFHFYYQRLRTVELSLSPPILYEPPPPRIAGIFLGEEE